MGGSWGAPGCLLRCVCLLDVGRGPNVACTPAPAHTLCTLQVALQEILEDGAGIPIASDVAEVAGPEENGHRPALRASLQLETIDSDDELMGDPLHEDLDINPA